MKFKLKERELVTGLAVGITAFVAIKHGFAGRIPALGPVPGPIVTIALGIAIASFIDGAGLTGDIASGVGYGLIAAGALGL